MKDEQFITTVEKIVTDDPRFLSEAYEFISDAVIYTTEQLQKTGKKKRHISGKELLEGIKDFAISEYGPIAKEVLESWGIKDTMSIGYIVFNMVDNQLLGSSKEDTIEDFKDGFDFESAFSIPFSPEMKTDSVPVIDE